MGKKIKFLTETAVLLALLVVLQGVTQSVGQLLTGSCVNTVLAVATLAVSPWSGVVLAVLSPFVAFLFGIGPKLIWVVPMICVGNLLFVLLLWALSGKPRYPIWRKFGGGVLASTVKAAALYLLVVQLLCHVLTLPEKQVATFSVMFSWPQLVTALIGSTLALLLVPVIQKARQKN